MFRLFRTLGGSVRRAIYDFSGRRHQNKTRMRIQLYAPRTCAHAGEIVVDIRIAREIHVFILLAEKRVKVEIVVHVNPAREGNC